MVFAETSGAAPETVDTSPNKMSTPSGMPGGVDFFWAAESYGSITAGASEAALERPSLVVPATGDLLRPFDELPGTGVDLDAVALLDVGGHLDFQAGLQD